MGIVELFSFDFMQRALIVGLLVAIICSVLGVFLVLRRLSMIGDGLAHVTFGSVALALYAGISGAGMLLVSLPVVMISSLGILRIAERSRLGGDAAIGIVSSTGIALGVLLAAVGKGFGIDLFSYLFGSMLAISRSELIVAIVLFVVVGGVLWFYYNDLCALSFNDELAKVSGINTGFLNSLLALLTALTVVLAMKLVGVMLISAMLILPASTALQISKSFRMTMVVSVATGLITVLAGVVLSALLNLPTGATIILLAIVMFAMSIPLGRWIRSSN